MQRHESRYAVAAPRDALSRALGIRLDDDALCLTALTHRSYAFEQGIVETNERLEFLGDAVLGWAVADDAAGAWVLPFELKLLEQAVAARAIPAAMTAANAR